MVEMTLNYGDEIVKNYVADTWKENIILLEPDKPKKDFSDLDSKLDEILKDAPAGGKNLDGAIWNATTDALAAGTSGTPANATNYYEGYGVMTNGITPYGAGDYDAAIAAGVTSPVRGFTIGTSAHLNIAGSIISWKAFRD